MQRKMDNRRIGMAIVLMCIAIEAVFAFLLHRKIVFIMDDLWYATKLTTGEMLVGLGDIWEGQVWHYFNWGGRSVTHALLQLVIMGGELFADILNLLIMFLLSYLICEISGNRRCLYFGMAFAMIISMNANIRLSMFWQSGSLNYLYSSCWILVFLLLYLREVKQPGVRKIPGVTVWVIPLGLIAGWSTENMGPASFLFSVMAIFY